MRKTGIVFCIIILLFALSSCGNYSKVQKELGKITIESTLPEVSGGAETLNDIKDDIFRQQLALCNMFAEAYDKTDLDIYVYSYSDIDRRKLISLLNDTREQLNYNSKVCFVENLAVLTENVSTLSNKTAYIQKLLDEVNSFLNDYRKFIKDSEDKAADASDIIRKYGKTENSLALHFLLDHRDEFTEYSIQTIENNANVTASFRATINKNNEIIDALNSLYGGAGSSDSERINAASKKLVEKLLHSMETLKDEERKRLLEQLNNGDTLSISR